MTANSISVTLHCSMPRGTEFAGKRLALPAIASGSLPRPVPSFTSLGTAFDTRR